MSVQKIKNAMLDELSQIEGLESAVKGFDHRISIIGRYLEQLKQYASENRFSSVNEECLYFKEEAPFFYGLYFECLKLYNLEVRRIVMNKKIFRKYLKEEMAIADAFAEKHTDFILYWTMGETHFDDRIFVRNAPYGRLTDELSVVLDKGIPPGTYRAAWIMAYANYKTILLNELNWGSGKVFKEYSWKAGKSAAGEMAQLIHATKALEVDGKQADLKQIGQFFDEVLQCPLGNIYDVIGTNNARKKDKHPFLRKGIKGEEE